jgi:AcrR family transcriptional regulator
MNMIQDTFALSGTRDTVVEAAERLFTRFGYAKVTMDEIGAEAGLKQASLYYYYATKEDLFRADVEQKGSEFREHIERILNAEDSATSDNLLHVPLWFILK